MKEKLFGLALVLIILGSFVVRLYRFDNPIADWHSWRQADTASVTRSFVKEGFDPLYPKFNIYNSPNEGSLPNPNRYFFVEFPIFNIIHYLGYKYIGLFTLEEWGRIVSIISSAITVLFLYLLVSIFSSKRVALFSAFFFAFLPYNIYYGRTILPDPMSVMFSVVALYFIALWTKEKGSIYAVLGGLAFAGALLTKPYTLVLLLPIGYLILSSWPTTFLKKWGLYAFFLISLLPIALWRTHIGNYPEAVPPSVWLFNQGNIRFTGAYFHWLVFDRMNRLIFATGGFVLFFLGLIRGLEKKSHMFYYFWLASIFMFFVIIAKGNVTHDYYQLPLVPIGSIFIAIGLDSLISYGRTVFAKRINLAIALALVLFTFAFGWFENRGNFDINNWAMVHAGQEADRILPKDAKVIAPALNDSNFLYQTNRNGWTLGGVLIPKYIGEGAQYLVTFDFDKYTNFWADHCKVLERTNEFMIVDLSQCSDISNPPQ